MEAADNQRMNTSRTACGVFSLQAQLVRSRALRDHVASNERYSITMELLGLHVVE
jgi:hypothetical protein